jgi:hypothetical protein
MMNECEGAVILGLKTIIAQQSIKKNETDKKYAERNDIFLPTPWNHLEAGIAFALDLPLLIIREEGVEGGIFDVGVTDGPILQIDLSAENKSEQQVDLQIEEYFKSERFLQPFNQWHDEVIVFRWDKTRKEIH